MNSTDHVWANSSATAPPPHSSLWLSTLVDVVTQWGWLFATIVFGCLYAAAFGERPSKEG